MKVKVDESISCGCGPCEEICPIVFKIDGEIARVQVDLVPPGQEAAVREALDRCPTGAISIEE